MKIKGNLGKPNYLPQRLKLTEHTAIFSFEVSATILRTR